MSCPKIRGAPGTPEECRQRWRVAVLSLERPSRNSAASRGQAESIFFAPTRCPTIPTGDRGDAVRVRAAAKLGARRGWTQGRRAAGLTTSSCSTRISQGGGGSRRT